LRVEELRHQRARGLGVVNLHSTLVNQTGSGQESGRDCSLPWSIS
jgi:hypothetical protein